MRLDVRSTTLEQLPYRCPVLLGHRDEGVQHPEVGVSDAPDGSGVSHRGHRDGLNGGGVLFIELGELVDQLC